MALQFSNQPLEPDTITRARGIACGKEQIVGGRSGNREVESQKGKQVQKGGEAELHDKLENP